MIWLSKNMGDRFLSGGFNTFQTVPRISVDIGAIKYQGDKITIALLHYRSVTFDAQADG